MTSRETDPQVDPAQVKAVAANLALRGPVTIKRIASQLGTSSRTLQRQLAHQGVSLRELVVESRMEIARVLLCKTDLDVQEIALRAGYSTPSSFGRAFSAWAGCSPKVFRAIGGRQTNK